MWGTQRSDAQWRELENDAIAFTQRKHGRLHISSLKAGLQAVVSLAREEAPAKEDGSLPRTMLQARMACWPTTRLHYATLRPAPRQVPRKAAVLHCPEHNMPACARCKERRRGVRNCCRLGHHKEGYFYKPQSKGICSTHSMGICDRCKINRRGVPYCCRSGHHEAIR